VVHITDLSKDQSYLDGEPVAVSGVEVGKARTLIIVPMLREKGSLVPSRFIARKFDHSPTS
jgi:hypothetical protein